MKREDQLRSLAESDKIWDFVVIGGGATGLGIAVDAASRGYSVALLEQSDFAKGTSNKSTKLVHGGVRYLAQFDVGLVFEALYERGLLLKNAPHLVRNQKFIIPTYRWYDKHFYTIGLTLYDVMAGRMSFGRSLAKSRKSTISMLPTVRKNGLTGGVLYHDGQFDDSRLAINLAQSARGYMGVVLNYVKVTSLIKKNGIVKGVEALDLQSGAKYNVQARVVVNATGVFVDSILKMDSPDAHHMIRPSQGTHIVLDHSFLGGDTAIMIPKTDDGRVLFAVPWHDKVIVGTTDTPMVTPELDPVALTSEVDFILSTAGRYLSRKPERSDVLSVFAGMRPLAAPKSDDNEKTKEISRRHKVIVSDSGLVTIVGGKWTTYRRMAQDTIDRAIKCGMVPPLTCITADLKIHGYKEDVDFNDPMYVYGSDKRSIVEIMQRDPGMADKLHERYPYTKAEVVWAVRQEMALTVEDVLSRRIRLLLLDARAAVEVAPKVAAIMAVEMGRDKQWKSDQIESFNRLANNYII